MMRSPYKSPEQAPPRRFLRLPRRRATKGAKALFASAGLVLAYLIYSFIGTDSGLLRIRALKQDTETLRLRKADLLLRASAEEQSRKAAARDPLVEERVARERFHLVKKDEIVYRYEEAADSAR
jgi:cell division protein FtsB